jgi:hypothetical protein
MKIESVLNLLEALESIPEEGNRMFRGQTRDWPLLPSIGRYPAAVKGYGDWRIFHNEVINRFLRLGHPFLNTLPNSGPASWVIGQHHGLPTRLLDTTTNPLKALFFSINQPAEDMHDGVLWVFSYNDWREDLDEEYRDYWEKELIPFLPAQLTPRLTAQEGAFISYPLQTNQNPLEPIEKLNEKDFSHNKFVVPANAKATLRREHLVFSSDCFSQTWMA